jgi:hypothetical protein
MCDWSVNLRLVVSPSDIGHSEAAPRGGVKSSLKFEIENRKPYH